MAVKKPVKKAAKAASKPAARKPVAKKSAPAKPAKKPVPARKPVAAKKVAPKKVPAKKLASRKAAPSKAAPAKAAPKKAAAKKLAGKVVSKAPLKQVASAKKAVPAKKPVPAKKAAVKAPAKSVAKKAAPVAARKPAPVVAAKKAAPAPAKAAPRPIAKTVPRSAKQSAVEPVAAHKAIRPRKPLPVGKVVVARPAMPSAPAPRSKAKVIAFKNDESGRPILPKGYKPSAEEEYMGPLMTEYFRQRLLNWRADLVEESKQTIENLKDEVRDVGDEAERATRETENSLELRTRDRYRKLIGKIDSTLKRVETNEYGYSVDSGEEIGLDRLEARLTAERTIDEQERWEHLQKQIGD